MKDLIIKVGRIVEIKKLENSFLITLEDKGFDIAPDVVCQHTLQDVIYNKNLKNENIS